MFRNTKPVFVSYVYSFSDDTECERYYGNTVLDNSTIRTEADVRAIERQLIKTLNKDHRANNRSVVWLDVLSINYLQ